MGCGRVKQILSSRLCYPHNSIPKLTEEPKTRKQKEWEWVREIEWRKKDRNPLVTSTTTSKPFRAYYIWIYRGFLPTTSNAERSWTRIAHTTHTWITVDQLWLNSQIPTEEIYIIIIALSPAPGARPHTTRPSNGNQWQRTVWNSYLFITAFMPSVCADIHGHSTLFTSEFIPMLGFISAKYRTTFAVYMLHWCASGSSLQSLRATIHRTCINNVHDRATRPRTTFDVDFNALRRVFLKRFRSSDRSRCEENTAPQPHFRFGLYAWW